MWILHPILSLNQNSVPDTMSGVIDVLAENGVIPTELSASMKNTVGFRNIAVHSYQTIDWTIVYGICKERFKDLQSFARLIAEYAERSPRLGD